MDEQDILQRQQVMVNELKEKNFIKSRQVEQAFLNVPRCLFIPDYPLERVYTINDAIITRTDDQGIPTSSCSAPDVMAMMLEMLDLQPGQRVLEIGAATGYNAALIGAIVGPEGKVVTIDIQPDLVESAREHLDAADFPWVTAVAADGGYGYPYFAPYDRIILTTCPWSIAPAWREQLKEGGRLVLPLELEMDHHQKVVALIRQGEELVSIDMNWCGFMHLQGAFARPARPSIVRTQVGEDPRLVLMAEQERPEEAERVSCWLKEPTGDYPTGIIVTKFELELGLFPWSQKRHEEGRLEDDLVSLVADGELADSNSIPALMGARWNWNGELGKSIFTTLALDSVGCAALVRPVGVLVPLMEYGRFDQDQEPFELFIRQFGKGERAVQTLLKPIREWNDAGKPTLERFILRAVPAEAPVTLAEGEQLWKRPWTNLVVRYL